MIRILIVYIQHLRWSIVADEIQGVAKIDADCGFTAISPTTKIVGFSPYNLHNN